MTHLEHAKILAFLSGEPSTHWLEGRSNQDDEGINMGLLDSLPEARDAQELEDRTHLEEVLKGVLGGRTDNACAEVVHSFMEKVGDQKGLDLLIGLLAVREAASAETSMTIGAVRCLKQVGQQAMAPLTQALLSENPLLRKRAVIALSEIGDPAAIESLMPLLEDRKSFVREAAQDALDRLGAADNP
jgi:hypothetical protein